MLKPQKEDPIIISVGGSLIVPQGEVNEVFLKKLNIFIREQVERGKRFFLVAGAGKIGRKYRDAGKAVIGSMTDADLDWLGIHTTRLNAHLLRTIFSDIAHPRIIENYDKKLRNWKEPIVVGAGWKPGWSTDYDAVILARDYGANLMINLSNIDWVYDNDPNKYKDAKAIKKLTWEEMEKLVGNKWSPGINAPLDPIASQLAHKLNLTVIVTNGENFSNLKKIVEGDDFKGTVIMPFKIDASFYDREYYTGKKGGYKHRITESLFGAFFRRLAALYRALVIKLFINPKTCLDVGCGRGILISYLRKLGVEAYGVELSKTAMELAQDDIRSYIKEGDIVNIPFENDRFDLVLTFDVLEHLDRSKIKQAIDETVRVSKKHILHKIYTVENKWITYFHKRDFSRVSVFQKKYWQHIFIELHSVSVLRNSLFRLPSFFETIFLLKKK
ncbi:UMP kinase [Candidatus Roizmanbacteria bacterium CG_4_10_14_0_8_um_filter_33_9]|uniref:UMP kinase n=1 Tax=Candidatus Roizmanbacteria bacterium CG_4_10_14_0_8_um_filter_33_9 TaxID=1974826 RepID=A0A2M7QHU1_9BACT|nr:MAG: UMP kinase [Candidatus Roizmanbacteria bacterium CG_4_10_14_0_8_um_filter_33_9]